MTNTQMKQGLNSEIQNPNITNRIKKVTEVGVNTVLVFEYAIDDLTKSWLQKRFTHGVSFTDTDHSLCFINTPSQSNKIEVKVKITNYKSWRGKPNGTESKIVRAKFLYQQVDGTSVVELLESVFDYPMGFEIAVLNNLVTSK